MMEGDSSPRGNESLAPLPRAAAMPQCHGGTLGSPTWCGAVGAVKFLLTIPWFSDLQGSTVEKGRSAT